MIKMSRSRKLSILTIIVAGLGALTCRAEEFYVSQSGSGSKTGLDLSNAAPVSWLNSSANWATGSGKISPGDTVNLSGTITTPLQIAGDGTSGSPITIRFMPNAKLSAPYWDSTGAISASNLNYVTIDGGENGRIEATANGTSRTYKQDPTFGVSITNAIGVTVKNLTVAGLYVRTPNSSDSRDDSKAIVVSGSVSNILIQNCVVSDSKYGIVVAFTSSASSGIGIQENKLIRTSTGIVVGSGGSSARASNVTVVANEISGCYAWDGSWTPPPGDGHHHSDGIHLWAVHTGSSISNCVVSRNRIGPDMGGFITGWVFTEGPISNLKVVNNLFTSDANSAPTNGFVAIKGNSASPTLIANNTFTVGGKGTAVYVASSAAGSVTLKNNISKNASAAVYLPRQSLASANGNLWSGTTAPRFYVDGVGRSWTDWKAMGFDSSGRTDDPIINLLTGEIGGLSPAIDAALDLSTQFTDDLLGNQRPQGGAWDIGAIEYTGASSSTPSAPNSLSLTN